MHLDIDCKDMIKVHNKFHAVLYDENGAEKMEAFAENIVLDEFWSILLSSSTQTLFYRMMIGTGSGTLSTTRTALFNRISTASFDTEAVEYNEESRTLMLNIAATFGVGLAGNVTEVGLGPEYDSGYTNNSRIITHAFFVDSENNPITIPKADTDILVVSATVYAGIGTTVAPVMLPNNSMARIPNLASVFTNNFSSGVNSLQQLFKTPISYSVLPSLSSKITDLGLPNRSISVGNANQVSVNVRRTTYPLHRIGISDGNFGFYNQIYIPPFGHHIPLPNSEIFPPYMLSPMEVGRGDGVRTKWPCPIPVFLPGTEEIRVGGTLLERDLDYTVDPQGNSIGHTSAPMASLKTVDITGPQRSSGTTTPPPFMNVTNTATVATTTNTYRIGDEAEGGLVYELEQAERVNTIKTPTIRMGSGTATITSLRFEYSLDGEEWVTAHDYGDMTVGTGAYPDWTPIFNPGIVTLEETITAKWFRLVYTSATAVYAYGADESWFGYVCPDGIKFTTPPPDNALITFRAMVDRPWKDENYVIDSSFTVTY